MAVIAPMNYIEVDPKNIPRIMGTPIRVSEVVIMHLKNNSSIEWIVENFEMLNHARIHAALAYYYDHQAQIDAEINEPEDFSDGIVASEHLAKLRARLKKD